MRRFILNNHLLKGVVYKTENIVVRKIQEGKKNDKCFIIGTGSSLSVDSQGRIIHHDPAQSEFNPMLSKDYTIYIFYFTFEALGLKEASKDIANFVGKLHDSKNYGKITLVGHSKSGICVLMAAETFTFKVNLVTISTPFYGTVMADKEKAEAILKFRPFIFIYRKIFSNHNVDKDITPSARIDQHTHNYNCNNHINVMSEINSKIDCKDPLDFILLFLNWYMKINGDGIVPFSSQSLSGIPYIKTIKIFSSHAHSLVDGLKILDSENLI